MQSIGLILEANPFHNGHKLLIENAKKNFPNATIISVCSTSFTMRGEISIINKFDKINLLLDAGVDIVLELPVSYTLQSADYFALSTIKILNDIGITDVIVGSETTDLTKLAKFYEIIKSDEFKKALKSINNKESSYKNTISNVLKLFDVNCEEINEFNQPNFTLAFQYYTAIKDHNFNINLHLIKRTTEYYQENDNKTNIASASYIRKNYYNKVNINKYLPYIPNFIDFREAENNLIKILRFQTLTYPFTNPFENINGNTEGIGNYILKNGDFANSYQDLLNSLTNKKYSTSRIRRLLLSQVLGLKNIEFSNISYLRLLGINDRGLKYINKLPNSIKKLIFSSPNEVSEKTSIPLVYEIYATKLYGLLLNDTNYVINEYKLPIRKKDKNDIT